MCKSRRHSERSPSTRVLPALRTERPGGIGLKQSRNDNSGGFILLLVLILMTTLSAVGGALIVSLTTEYRATKIEDNDSKAMWLAEAGIQKAVWNLMTTVGNGGQGEDWTTADTTENLGGGTYKMEVVRWDWALAANGGVAVATSEEAGHEGSKVIDGDDDTYWETVTKPLPPGFEHVTITFPYKLTINKARYFVQAANSQKAPKEYEWQVSSDDVTYTTAFSNASGTAEQTDEFAAQSNVKYLRLYVTKIGGGAKADGMIVATVEAIGSKVTSTGTVNSQARKIERTVAVDDGTTEAYEQIDWDEIAA